MSVNEKIISYLVTIIDIITCMNVACIQVKACLVISQILVTFPFDVYTVSGLIENIKTITI